MQSTGVGSLFGNMNSFDIHVDHDLPGGACRQVHKVELGLLGTQKIAPPCPQRGLYWLFYREIRHAMVNTLLNEFHCGKILVLMSYSRTHDHCSLLPTRVDLWAHGQFQMSIFHSHYHKRQHLFFLCDVPL